MLKDIPEQDGTGQEQSPEQTQEKQQTGATVAATNPVETAAASQETGSESAPESTPGTTPESTPGSIEEDRSADNAPENSSTPDTAVFSEESPAPGPIPADAPLSMHPQPAEPLKDDARDAPDSADAAQKPAWQDLEAEWLASREAEQSKTETNATDPGEIDASATGPGETGANATTEHAGAEEPELAATPAKDAAPVPSKIFAGLSWITPLLLAVLAVFLAAQPAWITPELGRVAATPEDSLAQHALLTAQQNSGLGAWIVPQIEGQPVKEVLPLQLWWKAAQNKIDSYLPPQYVGCLGPILAAWLMLLAAMTLGWTDSRHGRRGGLAAGLLAYCGLAALGTVWLAPALLPAPALSVLATACLLRGLKRNSFSPVLVLGGLFMALAALGGGVLLGLLPLAAALLTIIFQLNFSRLGQWDLAFCLGLALLVVGGWFTAGLLFAGSGILRAYLGDVSTTVLASTAGASPIWAFMDGLSLPEMLGMVLLCFVPWIVLPALMPVRSLKSLGRGLREWKQKQKYTEAVFLSFFFLLSAAAVILTQPFQEGLLLVAYVALAALAARSLTNLSPAQNNRWGAFCTLFMLLAAAITVLMFLDLGRQWLSEALNIHLPGNLSLKVWLVPAVGAVIGAITIWFFGRGKSSQAGLLVIAFAMLLYTQAFAWSALSVIHPQLTRGPGPALPDTFMPEINIINPLPPQSDVPDGPRLHLPLPPDSEVFTAPEMPLQEIEAETPEGIVQPGILGAPMPGQTNATVAPGDDSIVDNSLDGGLGIGADGGPVPDAGGFLYGDDLTVGQDNQAPPAPVAPYQPGLHREEPPLPLLDTPVPITAPQTPPQPLLEPLPPQN